MYKKSFLAISFFSNFAFSNDYRFPAEWEPQKSVWIAWPTYSNRSTVETEQVTMNIINALYGHSEVNLLSQSDKETDQIRSRLKAKNISTNHLKIHSVPHSDIWVRDMGPVFIYNEKKKSKEILDFGFNLWSYQKVGGPEALIDEQVDRAVSEILNLNVLRSHLIHEGGGHEMNSLGTLITTESVAMHRNPHLSKAEIEKEFNRVLGAKQVIWLPRGLAEEKLSYEGPLK